MAAVDDIVGRISIFWAILNRIFP